MKRFFFAVAIVAIALTLTTGENIHAKPTKSGNQGKNVNNGKSTGKGPQGIKGNQGKFWNGNKGWSYGRGYIGWNAYCYFPDYGCYGFYDPATLVWYYWSDSSEVFLPTSSMAALPPQTSGADLLPPGAIRVPQQ